MSRTQLLIVSPSRFLFQLSGVGNSIIFTRLLYQYAQEPNVNVAKHTLPIQGEVGCVSCAKFSNWVLLSASPPERPVTSSAITPFTPWEPPQPPNTQTSSNGRRVEAMTCHRITPLVPSRTTSTALGRASRQNRGNCGGGRAANTDGLLQIYRFDIAILGYLVCTNNHTLWMHLLISIQLGSVLGIEEADTILRKIFPDRLPDLLAHMNSHNLIINVNTSTLPTDNATKILQDVIEQHLV
jgi:hypothetical protein